MGWLSVGLTLCENPKSSFCQITCGSPDSDSMPFATTSAFIEMDDVLAAPAGVVAMADDDVSGSDKSPVLATFPIRPLFPEK